MLTDSRSRTVRRRDRRILLATAAIVAVDLATKLAATATAAGSRSGAIVPVHNPDLSLGTAHASLGVALVLAVIGIVVAARLTIRPARRGAMSPWIPAAIIGGAAANFVDRAIFGAVHDFVATPILILNVADVAVAAGIIAAVAHFRRVR